jgi:hypothetical protein
MNSLEEKKAARFRFLHALYERAEGDQYATLPAMEFGADLGFSQEQIEKIVQYLEAEHLVKSVAFGWVISITHDGVRQVEAALSSPERATHYFPPVVNILHVQSMVNSQIQQGSHSSTQSVAITQSQITSLQEYVSTLRSKIPELGLRPDLASELDSDAATVEVQLASANPKRGIIKESLSSARTILEGAAGNLIASDLLGKLIPLLANLS